LKVLNRFINLWGVAGTPQKVSLFKQIIPAGEEGFNKDMALFMVLGILNSLFVTLFLYGKEKKLEEK